jgi:uncharacterized protein
MATARITGLYIYPVKSCRGISLPRAQLLATGLAGDRGWLIVDARGRFLTQRELPAMALIGTAIEDSRLRLSAPGLPDMEADAAHRGERLRVKVWNDECWGIDAGAAAAEWLSRFLGRELRLVSFDATAPRDCEQGWLGDAQATTQFADAYPLLVISEASLADLNARMPRALPMNRFRPNIVVNGVEPFAEDGIRELRGEGFAIRPVKPCTRCVITTTEQSSGERDGEEPLRTLKGYRWDASLRGVAFGQNAIVTGGAGQWLAEGQELEVIRA